MRLTGREKGMIMLGGVALALFVLFQFVIFPLVDHRARLHKRLATKEKGLVEMRVLKERYQRLHQQSDAMASQLAQRAQEFSLFAFLERNAEESEVKEHIAFMKPSAAPEGELLVQSRVEMKLQGVGLEQLLRFLERSEAPNNLVGVAKMTIQENSREEGTLDATLVIVSVDRALAGASH